MTYTKKTWSTGETVEASELNNMEAGIDDIHSNNWTVVELDGLKDWIFGTMYITGATGGNLMLRNVSGSMHNIVTLRSYFAGSMPHLEIKGEGPDVNTKLISNIFEHDHDGGYGGEKVSHANLNDVFSDQHHDRDHASRHNQSGADPVDVGTPSDIGTSNWEGSGNELVRIDHVHKHPSGLGADLHHDQSHGPTDHTDRDIVKSHVFTPGMNMIKWESDFSIPVVITSPDGWNNSMFPYMVCAVPTGGKYFGGHFTTPTEFKDGQVDNLILTAQTYMSGGTIGKKVRFEFKIAETRADENSITYNTEFVEITLDAVNERKLLQVKYTKARSSADPRTIIALYIRRYGATSDEYDGEVRLEGVILEFTQDQ